MKNTTGATSDAAFISRNVRAGELSRFRGKPFGINRSSSAIARSAMSDSTSDVRSGEEPKPKVAITIRTNTHGSASRENLCEKKWNRIRFFEVKSCGKRVHTCH